MPKKNLPKKNIPKNKASKENSYKKISNKKMPNTHKENLLKKNTLKENPPKNKTTLSEIGEKIYLNASKYPKIITFIFCIILAVYFSQKAAFLVGLHQLESMGYLGILIIGTFYSFGFTTPFATIALLNLHPTNILLAAIIGGIGATVSDFLIFKFVKFSFEDEFIKLKNEWFIVFVKEKVSSIIPPILTTFITFIIGGIFLSSPLPDEGGIMILTGVMNIKPKLLVLISLFFKTIGILFLLAVQL